ncbi:MAG: hypothetical protein ACXWVR_05490, partial [Rhodoplanes sp.]
LIAFVLLHLLHKMTKAQQGFLELVRLVRANLMHRKDATRLRQIQSPRKSTPVNWTSTGEIHEPDSRGSSPAMTKEAVAGSSRQGTKKTVGQIRQ